MRKRLVPALTALALAATSTAAVAQGLFSQGTSVSCAYMLLRVYKAEMDYCKVPLQKDRLDRYSRMRANLELFIRGNAKNDPEAIIANVENNAKRAIAALSSCQSEDFKLAQQAMDRLTTPDNERLVFDSLQIKRDPQQGSCG